MMHESCVGTLAAVSLVDAANISDVTVVGRLAVSLAVGEALGLERELDGQEAGLRTHALLALGAGIFGVISVGAFGSFASDSSAGNVSIDPTRIASYVAAGVGFLAGGTIVRGATRVKGLTTAASLWVCAGVGLAAGLGFTVGAIAGTVGALFLLLLERPLARLRRTKERVALQVRLRVGGNLDEVMATVLDLQEGNFHPNITTRRIEGAVIVEITDIRMRTAQHLMTRLSAMPVVDEATLLTD